MCDIESRINSYLTQILETYDNLADQSELLRLGWQRTREVLSDLVKFTAVFPELCQACQGLSDILCTPEFDINVRCRRQTKYDVCNRITSIFKTDQCLDIPAAVFVTLRILELLVFAGASREILHETGIFSMIIVWIHSIDCSMCSVEGFRAFGNFLISFPDVVNELMQNGRIHHFYKRLVSILDQHDKETLRYVEKDKELMDGFAIGLHVEKSGLEWKKLATDETDKPTFTTYEHYIGSLVIHYFKYEGMHAHSLLPSLQEKEATLGRILGPFRNGDWHLISLDGVNFEIDLERMPCFHHEDRRPTAQQLARSLADGKPFNLLLAVTGSGKTSSIADLAIDHYIIYIECCSTVDHERSSEKRRRDEGYVSMVDMLRQSLGQDRERNSREAERIFAIEIFVRIAQLFALFLYVKKKGRVSSKLSPSQFWTFQREIGDEMARTIRNSVTGFSFKKAEQAIKNVTNMLFKDHLVAGTKLIIAVDEIEVASEEFRNKFAIQSLGSGVKGLLAPMISMLSKLCDTPGLNIAVVLSGTGSSLGRERSLRSLLGYEDDLMVIMPTPESFPSISVSACKRFLRKLNAEDIVDLDQLSEGSKRALQVSIPQNSDTIVEPASGLIQLLLSEFVIGGRYGILASIVANILLLRKKHTSASKSGIFCEAVVRSLNSFRDALVARLHTAITDENLSPRNCDAFLDLLVSLHCTGSLTGKARVLESTYIAHDLMILGLGNYRSGSNKDNGYFELDEALVSKSIHAFLDKHASDQSQYRQAKEEFRRFLELFGRNAAKGTFLENVVVTALCSKAFQDKRISELPFVKPFLPVQHRDKMVKTEVAESEWWKSTVYRTTTKFSHHMLMDETTPGFLASRNSHGVVYVPETYCRPDAILKLDDDHAIVLGITIWSSPVDSNKYASQYSSTNLERAYCCIDGSKNKNCLQSRRAWVKHKLHELKSVRIHIFLPEVQSQPVLEQTVGPDHIIIQLDLSNCDLLFNHTRIGQSVMKLLRLATNRMHSV